MSSASKVKAALAAAIIFLFLSSCAAYLAFARLDISQRWVQHTRDVQGALGEFSAAMNRANRIRGEYVESGNPSVLQRQTEAVLALRSSLAAIQRLTDDNAGQQSSCRKLALLTEQRIALMNKAIDLKRTGKSSPDAQALVNRQLNENGDSTDQLVQAMYDAEQGLLGARQMRAGSSFAVAAGVLITSLFLALVLFLVHHQLLSDQVRERTRAESSLRALSARLLTVQDEERRKFARELHDSVGQQLVAMKMGISMLQGKLPGDPTVRDCLKLLDDCITETRTISHLLHPPLLDEAGLQSALRWFVEGFAKRSGVEVNLEIRDGKERLTEATELVLFRVLQESLTNVHRHSGATRAEVSLDTSSDLVVLKIRDHGRGVPQAIMEKLRENGTGGGVGLAGMTQRIREIGGRLEINSGAGGTEIVARIPLVPRKQPPRMISSAPQEVSG